MSQQLERISVGPTVWCGRSWEALRERRAEAFEQAVALQNATPATCGRVVSDFLEFFDATGVGLFRDEEEWVFRTFRPTPTVVIRALEEHIMVTSLIKALVVAGEAGCVDLRVVHHLGELLDAHLAMEEDEVRPLIGARRLRAAAPRRAPVLDATIEPKELLWERPG